MARKTPTTAQGQLVSQQVPSPDELPQNHFKAAGRAQLEAQIVDNVTNSVEEVIAQNAPLDWPDETWDQLKLEVLDRTKATISALSAEELRLPTTLSKYVRTAASVTKILIDERRVVNPAHAILDQLAKNTTLLPKEMVEEIGFGLYPALEEIVEALLIGSEDCLATIDNDAKLNQRRIGRVAVTNSFLLALTLAQNFTTPS